MYAVGIDVSKGRSTVAVLEPLGKTVAKPFEVRHTKSGMNNLVNYLTQTSHIQNPNSSLKTVYLKR